MLSGALRRGIQFALFRDGWISARELVPNFFTLLSICTGLLAIKWAIEREFEWALAAIVASTILDSIDGRMARMLNAQSKFGEEFDSLADFVAFGVAPAFLIFNWGLSHLDGIGWAVVTILALACGVRLARFNAAIDRKRFAWEHDYFMGVPAPAGAILSMLPLYLDGLRSAGDPLLPGLTLPSWATWAVAAYTLTIAILMVSTIPTYAGKSVGDRIAREHPVVLAGIGVGLLWLMFAYPFATLAAGTVLYLLAMPLGIRRYLQLVKSGLVDDDLEPSLSGNPGE
ncbi:MAG: CDP-diacylglycerol--serine O-phosphatidyltransferase [Hyphomicrobiaceae bacterium]